MRILFAVGRVIPPLFIGGAEVSLRILANKLIKKGHQVHIIGSFAHPRHGESEHYSQLILNDLKFDSISTHQISKGHYAYNYNGITCEIMPQKLLVRKCGDYLQSHKPDIVITMLEGAEEFINISKEMKTKVALWIHDVFPNNIQALNASPSYSLYTSEFVKNRCELEYQTNGILFYPPFERPHTTKINKGIRRQHITMINPIPEKGGKTFIELAKSMCDQKFLAVEGWRKSELFDHTIPDNLEYFRKTINLEPIWNMTKILLVPSKLNEGFGRVVVEAGYFGVPSIALNVGGLPEAIGCGGVVLNSDNRHEWEDAISHIESKKDEYYIKAINNAIKYDINHESIINNLL